MRPPSVDVLARELADVGLPHPLLVDAARAAIAAGDPGSARQRAENVAAALLRPVVNATGVLLHTNLGRAPLGPSGPSERGTQGPSGPSERGAQGPSGPSERGTQGPAGQAQPGRYANLELDLRSGRRGSRSGHAASLLARAAGAEAAVVVNNNAGAVLLVLAALAGAGTAGGRSVLVSRGELVEIGGGFRVPEVMEQSGARLVEVGTTNRTRIADYRRALDDDTAVVLKVHQSNYRMVGFTEDVDIDALSRLGPPVVADIGSGLLDADTPWLAGGPPAWLAHEPAARQTLDAGAGLVTFSGDKLLGGPQAGIIAGRAELVEACARHPLSRALRPGALVLSALQETALAYLRRDGDAIPFWRMATASVDSLRSRGKAIVSSLGQGRVCDTVAVAGGGSLPGQDLPSAGVAVEGDVAGSLRANDPPVIARVRDGSTVCDLRAVDPADDVAVGEALRRAVTETT